MDSLYDLCVEGDLNRIRALSLDKNQLTAKYASGLQLIHVVSIHGHLDLMKYLVKEGAQINARDDQGMSPLHHACNEGHVAMVKWLMNQKIFKNNRNSDGKSPLLCAAANGHIDVVKVLFAENVFDFIVDNQGNSALHLANLYGHHELARYLVSNGMDANLKNNDGKVPGNLTMDSTKRTGSAPAVNPSNSSQVVVEKIPPMVNTVPTIPDASITSINRNSVAEAKPDLAVVGKVTSATHTATINHTAPTRDTNVGGTLQVADKEIVGTLTSHSSVNIGDYNLTTYQPKPKTSRSGSVPVGIKLRLASDASRVGDAYIESNATWDLIAEAISNSLKISTEVKVQGVVLVDKNGDELSAPINSKSLFWDAYSNYDASLNMMFEVYASSSSLKASDMSARAVSSIESKNTIIQVRLASSKSCFADVCFHNDLSWEQLIDLIANVLVLDKADALQIQGLTLVDENARTITEEVHDIQRFRKLVSSHYNREKGMTFDVVSRPAAGAVTEPVTVPEMTPQGDNVVATVDEYSITTVDIIADNKLLADTKTIPIEEKITNCDESNLVFALMSKLEHKISIEADVGASIEFITTKVQVALSLDEGAVDYFVLLDEEHDEVSPKIQNTQTFWKIVSNTYDPEEGMFFAVVVNVNPSTAAMSLPSPWKSDIVKALDSPVPNPIDIMPPKPKLPRTNNILKEIKFRLATDASREGKTFIQNNSTWEVVTEAVSYCLKLSSSCKIERMLLLNTQGDDLSITINDTNSFWEVFNRYDWDEAAMFEVHTTAITSVTTVFPSPSPAVEMAKESTAVKQKEIPPTNVIVVSENEPSGNGNDKGTLPEKNHSDFSPEKIIRKEVKMTKTPENKVVKENPMSPVRTTETPAFTSPGAVSRRAINVSEPDLIEQRETCKLKLRLSTGHTVSSIRMMFRSSWEDLTTNVKKCLKLGEDTAVNSFILIDGDGDELTAHLTNSAEFWKVVENTYDEDEDMLFEVIILEAEADHSSPLVNLELGEGGSDSNMSVVKFRLHSDTRRLASIRIHEDFSWVTMMTAVATGLSLSKGTNISWLVLVDADGNALSSKVTSIDKFRKLCSIKYESTTGMLYEVYLEGKHDEDHALLPVKDRTRSSVNSAAAAAAAGGACDVGDEPVDTAINNVVDVEKASEPVAEAVADAPSIPLEQIDKEKTNQASRINPEIIPFASGNSELVPIKMRMLVTEEAEDDDSSFTPIVTVMITDNCSWQLILAIVSNAFSISNPLMIDYFMLFDGDDVELSDKVTGDSSFWKVVYNIYDHEEDMRFTIYMKPCNFVGEGMAFNANMSGDEVSIMSGITRTMTEEELIIPHISRHVPVIENCPEQDGWILKVRLHSNPLLYSDICVSLHDSWEHVTDVVNLALNPSLKKEIHRLLLIDTSGVRTSLIVTTIEKLRQVLQTMEKDEKSIAFEVFYEKEQEISILDESVSDNNPISYQSLRMQATQEKEEGEEEGKDDESESTIKVTRRHKPSNIYDMYSSSNSLERRLLTAIDKARDKLKTIGVGNRVEDTHGEGDKSAHLVSPPSSSEPSSPSRREQLIKLAKASADVITESASGKVSEVGNEANEKGSKPIVSIRVRLQAVSSRVEAIEVPYGCSWVKLLFTVHSVFSVEIADIAGFVLRDEEKDDLSPKIVSDARFWKVYNRSYKVELGTVFDLLLSEEAQTKLVAASLASAAGGVGWGADILVRFRLHDDINRCEVIKLPQNCSWEEISKMVKKGLKLSTDVEVDRVLLVDVDCDQIIPALKSSTKFWKAVKDSFDMEEGMAFEVFVINKTSEESAPVPAAVLAKRLSSPTTQPTSALNPGTEVPLAEVAKSELSKVTVTARFCLQDDPARKVEVRLPLGCNWIKLSEVIANALGPMQPSWIQRVVLTDENKTHLSDAIVDGTQFWKVFKESFEIQQLGMSFAIEQSIRAAPLGSMNSLGFLTTADNQILDGPDMKGVDMKGLQAIHLAAVSNNIPMVKWLINAGCLVDTIDDHGMTAMHYACDGKYINLCLELVQSGADLLISNNVGLTPAHFVFLRGLSRLLPFVKPCQLNLANDSGLSFLHCACDEGSMDAAEYLLSNGAYVDVRDNDGMTPLHYACVHGHAEIAELLIEHGAFINARDDEGMSPFLYACSDGHLELASWLLSVGASLTARNDFGNNALHLACEHGNMELVNYLIFNGMDNSSRDKDGWTPLHYASKAGHVEIAMLLQGTGIDIWVQAHEKLVAQFEIDMTIERELRAQEEKDEVELIAERRKEDFHTINYPSIVDSVESPFNEFLREACIKGDNSTVKSLLVSGASVMCRNHNGSTPLHFACAGGHGAIAATLIEADAEVNTVNFSGSTPLHFAADKEFGALSLWMVEQKASPHVRNKDGFTPLHFLCSRGLADVVKDIYRVHPFDPNLSGSKGINLLHCCSEQGHANVGKVLLELGALVNTMDEEFKTGLHYACIRGHVQAAKNLVDGGAYVNVKDKAGNTPLFYACAGGYIELASKLESWGAKKDIRNRYGNTCLHSVCLLGQQGMAQWLIENGASLWVENRQGDTPYEYAVTSQNEHLLQWISAKYPDAEFRYRKT